MLVYQRIFYCTSINKDIFQHFLIVGISEYLISIFPSTNWNHHGKPEMTMESWDKTHVFFLSAEWSLRLNGKLLRTTIVDSHGIICCASSGSIYLNIVSCVHVSFRIAISRNFPLRITDRYLLGGAITILNNISQWEGLSHISWNKHVWNH